ncbi:hypothetical protein GS551_05315 [Rhodococcus hoagii]|uniref:Uncharacterized protein n=1 Tax=Rhodococcus hoagii TaxID=43767 RepID=A0AAE3B9H1_RHOHA|nr:hypothetical protein [Prescottella equi]NKS11993.1 hypothetical protein [Prescottella equi]NKS14643.1 hypothetical protein [Prescottella equi]NKS14648.1 hypothetical protein [Prescottella equi]NKS14654.1 hypothetical protein [Prescottella equi]
MSADDEMYGCGYEYDHTLDEVGRENDGTAVYVCRECGAEIWDEEDEDEGGCP